VRPVDPGRSSFMLACRLPLIVSTNGRPSPGPTSRRTRTAASNASASDCPRPSAHASQAGWNSTDQRTATSIIILLSRGVRQAPMWMSGVSPLGVLWGAGSYPTVAIRPGRSGRAPWFGCC
jgi:hypothetical protein